MQLISHLLTDIFLIAACIWIWWLLGSNIKIKSKISRLEKENKILKQDKRLLLDVIETANELNDLKQTSFTDGL